MVAPLRLHAGRLTLEDEDPVTEVDHPLHLEAVVLPDVQVFDRCLSQALGSPPLPREVRGLLAKTGELDLRVDELADVHVATLTTLVHCADDLEVLP
jgi:hypothetical protein